MSELRGGKRRSSRTRVRLPELPDEIMMKIVEKLSLKDAANLMSCCRVVASRAKYFYQQRREVNMSCFKSVTPSICDHLITRFSRSCLLKLHFCYDVHRRHKYDDETLEAILALFSFSTDREIALYSGRPRIVDILAHGYFLNKFLSSQQHLQNLEVDSEQVYVRGGDRRALVTPDIVGKNCPALESYWSHCPKFTPPHVRNAFLQSCPRLKFATVYFMVGIDELDTHVTPHYPLELQHAFFFLRKSYRPNSEEKRRTCETKLRILGSRLQKIETACVCFDREGCIKDCMALAKAMPPLRQLVLTLSYETGGDAGPAAAPFFVGGFSLLRELHHAPADLVFTNVPEEEFEKVVEVNALDMLPKEIEHLKVLFAWGSSGLDKAREALLDQFMYAASLRLKTCTVGATLSSSQDRQPAFLKTFKHCNIVNKTAIQNI